MPILFGNRLAVYTLHHRMFTMFDLCSPTQTISVITHLLFKYITFYQFGPFEISLALRFTEKVSAIIDGFG